MSAKKFDREEMDFQTTRQWILKGVGQCAVIGAGLVLAATAQYYHLLDWLYAFIPLPAWIGVLVGGALLFGIYSLIIQPRIAARKARQRMLKKVGKTLRKARNARGT